MSPRHTEVRNHGLATLERAEKNRRPAFIGKVERTEKPESIQIFRVDRHRKNCIHTYTYDKGDWYTVPTA